MIKQQDLNASKRLSRIMAWTALGIWILLLHPYPVTTFMSACVACVTFPFYERLRERLPGVWPGTVYATILFFLTALPIAGSVSLVVPQVVNGLHILDGFVNANWFARPENQALIASVDQWLKDIPGLEGGLRQLFSTLAGFAGTMVRSVLSSGLGIAGSAVNALLILLVFVMIALMCAIQGDTIYEFTQRLTSFSSARLNRFIVVIRKAILGVMVGIVLVAIIQGALCGIGFGVAGVPQPAFWGLLAALVAPIPFVGTALVWVPIVIWLWITGTTTVAVGTALWCVIVVAGVDNLLRPLFLKTGINATLVALILSIFCGLAAFGPAGVFAGPVLIAVAMQAARESSLCDAAHRRTRRKTSNKM